MRPLPRLSPSVTGSRRSENKCPWPQWHTLLSQAAGAVLGPCSASTRPTSKGCHHSRGREVGPDPPFQESSGSVHGLCLSSRFSLLPCGSKIRTSKAQQNKAIYFHRIYHPLNGLPWPAYYLHHVGTHSAFLMPVLGSWGGREGPGRGRAPL